jgi:hypothetical protein
VQKGCGLNCGLAGAEHNDLPAPEDPEIAMVRAVADQMRRQVRQLARQPSRARYAGRDDDLSRLEPLAVLKRDPEP